jgi:hypothetical protein
VGARRAARADGDTEESGGGSGCDDAATDALTQDDDCTGMDPNESMYSVPDVRTVRGGRGGGGDETFLTSSSVAVAGGHGGEYEEVEDAVVDPLPFAPRYADRERAQPTSFY